MKPSDILKFALERIESGKSQFICVAIGHSDMYKYKAYQYILKYKPISAKENDAWWPWMDENGNRILNPERINALKSAIADAEANGE